MKKLVAALVGAGLLLGVTAVGLACDSKDACLQAGKKAFAAKQYDKAKEYFKKAIQFDPKCEKAWMYYDATLKKLIVKELGEEEGC